MKTVYFYIICLLLCSCTHSIKQPLKLTVYQTYQPADVLPVFAAIDLRDDSLSTAKYVQQVNSMAQTPSDTFKTDVVSYLYSDARNSLFKKFRPNVDVFSHNRSQIIQDSSFLGFALDKDTLAVNKMISKYGIPDYGNTVNWIPQGYNDNGQSYSALVMLNPSFKAIDLDMNDFDKTEIKHTDHIPWWRFIPTLFDEKPYTLTAHINQKGLKKIKSVFAENTALLIKCDLNHKNIYTSMDSNKIQSGIHFNELTENDLQ